MAYRNVHAAKEQVSINGDHWNKRKPALFAMDLDGSTSTVMEYVVRPGQRSRQRTKGSASPDVLGEGGQ